jgi:hypothetical protein
MSKLTEYIIYSQEAERYLRAGNITEYKRHLKKAELTYKAHLLERGIIQ